MAKTLTVFLAADVSKLNRSLDSARGTMGAFSGSIDKFLGPALIGATAAAGALAVKLGVDGVKAAIEDQASLERLAQTLQNVGQAHNTDQVEAYISSLERTLGVADEELRPAYDRLVRSTQDTEEANRALALALDVSAGSGKSLDAVVQALGRAYDGNTAGLSRLGAGIDAATLKTGDMALITESLSKTFQGQAANSAATYEGQIKRLSTAVDNMKEAFGSGLLASLGNTDAATQDLVDTMGRLEPLIENVGGAVGTFASVALSDLDENLAFTAGSAEDAADSMGGLNVVAKIAGGFINDLTYALFGMNSPLGVTTRSLGAATGEGEKFNLVLSATVQSAIDAGNALANAAVEIAEYDSTYRAFIKRAQVAASTTKTTADQAERLTTVTNEAVTAVDKLTTSSGKNTTKLTELNAAQDAAIQKFKDQKTAVADLNIQFKDQQAEVGKAKDAISDYISDLSADITSGFNLGAGFQVKEGKADVKKWIAGVDSEISKFQWYGNVLEAVQREGSVQLREYLQAQGLDDAAVWGQALLDNGLVKIMADKLALVQTTAGTVAQSMVPEFLTAGEDSAIETLNGLATQLTKETDRLKKLGRNIGKPIGANIKAEIAEAVAQAIKDAEAAGTAARAEVAAREAQRQATLTEQATAQSLARLIRNSDSRAGRNVQPVLA